MNIFASLSSGAAAVAGGIPSLKRRYSEKAGPRSSPVRHPHHVHEVGIPKLSLREVTRIYRTTKGENMIALDRISLDIKAGEFLCIVGPSGCGKSSLLHLIAGLDHPASGEILLDGAPVNGPGTDRVLFFQEQGLFPWLTVRENVEFGMRAMSGAGSGGAPARANTSNSSIWEF